MRRRDFVKVGLGAGSAALISGCNTIPPDPSMSGKQPASADGANWRVPEFEYAEATIADLQRAQTEGRVTARALVEAYLARMDAIDTNGPRLTSVIERNADARRITDALDRERKDRGPRGALHGIPILIKD